MWRRCVERNNTAHLLSSETALTSEGYSPPYYLRVQKPKTFQMSKRKHQILKVLTPQDTSRTLSREGWHSGTHKTCTSPGQSTSHLCRHHRAPPQTRTPATQGQASEGWPQHARKWRQVVNSHHWSSQNQYLPHCTAGHVQRTDGPEHGVPVRRSTLLLPTQREDSDTLCAPVTQPHPRHVHVPPLLCALQINTAPSRHLYPRSPLADTIK